MERLLSRRDYEFLAANPSFSLNMLRKLEQERQSIALQYLRQLRQDFRELHRLARLALLHASEDRSGVALDLLKQKVTFERRCLLLRWRLATRGIGGVEAAPLVQAIQALCERLNSVSSRLALRSSEMGAAL